MSAAELLAARKEQLAVELAKTERQIYELESQYLMAEFTQLGTVLKGLDGFLSTKESLRKRAQRAYRVEDRLFSLSSTASPAAAELEQAQAEAAAADGGPARGGKGTYAGKAAAMKARRLSGMG